MKRAVVIVVATFFAVSALSLAEDENKSKPAASVGPAAQFGSSPGPNTTTSNPTTKPKTTTASPNSTTTKPPTTTASHNTTTAKPPTTTASPNTTTTKPPTTTAATTTTAAPTPPKPTPSTNLTVGNYSVTTDKKVICLMAQVALQIRLATPKANGTFIVQPTQTSPKGGCKETTANLTLAFKEGFITLMFNKSKADNKVYVDTLSFSLSYPLSRGVNQPYTAKNSSLHLFAAKIGHSYSCKKESVFMGNGLYLDISQDRMQAFNLTKSNEFGSPDVCAADQPDYRVAIAVGVTLLVLIVVVVVAYLLGRRKRTDGYQSL